MNKRVLILDDDLDILQICTIVLRKKGFDVSTLNSSMDIVEQVRSLRPDVILMDNWIPGPGGIEATRLLKKDPELKCIPVIFFSANSNVSQLASDARADYSLQKPFDISELEQIVNQAIAGHSATNSGTNSGASSGTNSGAVPGTIPAVQEK
jgi:CheY-like chemotaxis protein